MSGRTYTALNTYCWCRGQGILTRILFVCVGRHMSKPRCLNHFLATAAFILILGCVNVMCVSVFVSSCVREEIKIEAAHWVQAHSYAWIHSTGEVLTHTHVRGLTCHGIRLLSCAMLCSGMWCEADLGKRVCDVCPPWMEFMQELRDQTAAEGVCLVAMLVSLYPVGQFNWRFLSHQVSNSCRPAAKCQSKCARRAREGRGFWWKQWLTETTGWNKSSFEWGLHPPHPTPSLRTGICTLNIQVLYLQVYTEGSAWYGDPRGARWLVRWSRCSREVR